ncbi:MAG: adenylate kinase [Oligoflexia bacterium]|nr:adenylate kinase [Oligoflexia bacterium]
MNLVLFGPPGAGKGTQSQLIAEKFHLTHVSTGDLLRAAIKAQTPLGLEAKKYLDSGVLVSDSIVVGLIQEVMKVQKKAGMLLDGFPRTTAQAESLDLLLKNENAQVNRAIFLEVPRELLKSRLTGRRICSSCGATFHTILKPSKNAGICDLCQGKLEQRPDDKEEVIDTRLEVYEKSTAPLKSYFQKAQKFVNVDGVGEPNSVFDRICSAVKS